MRLRFTLGTWVAAALLFSLFSGAPGGDAPAQEVRPAPQPCTCSGPQDQPKGLPRPKLADHSNELDDDDEIATLGAIHAALTEVGDGSSFVWHGRNGRLSGVVHPTSSFKDASGRVCRHIVVVLTTGVRSGRVEGVACRLADGGWQLEG